MKISRSLCFLFAFFLTLLTLHAQTTPTKTGSLAAISFLDGHWKGTFNGGPIDAVWSGPAGDNIAGFIRMMKDNKVTMYELFAFEQTSAGPVALVKHFKPGLMGQEEKDKSDRYLFLKADRNSALFEKADSSIRIIYEKRAKDQLVIQRGEKKNGQWMFSDLFMFNRVL